MSVGTRQRCLSGARSTIALSILVALVAGLAPIGRSARIARAQVPQPPDIVLIVTDDQRFDWLALMPEVQRYLVDGGMKLAEAVVSNPLCCPSRATILTGRYSHTTGVYTNVDPNGGWNAFKPSESSTIATALDAVGYRTALIGKYLNGYAGPDIYVPPGWDRWLAFAGPNGAYYDYEMYDSVAAGLVSYGSAPEDYSTDVIGSAAVSFIRSTPVDTPMFLMVTPYAPHGPLIPAPRHQGLFADADVSFSPAVNERDVSDKPAYVRARSLGDLGEMRTRIRKRWEMLLAVDDLVANVFATLADTGRSDRTLVIFTSDNGLSLLENRWRGKSVPYETSIRVPLIARLPGTIPAGTVSSALVSNVDIAPTLADFAGATLPADGLSLRPLLTGAASWIRSSVVLEHATGIDSVPTYCGVRLKRFTFVRYATREEELYDLVADPFQLTNEARARPRLAKRFRTLARSLCRPPPPGFSW